MKRNIYILVVIFLYFTTMLQAQQTITVTKAEVLAKVSENNTSIKISEQDYHQSVADYKQTNATFLPNITASHSGMATTNPLMAFGAKLNQQVLIQNDFNPDILNDPSSIENYATKFQIQQPLINLDGHYQRQAARSQMMATKLQNVRTRDHLLLEVEKAYMQLQLAHKAAEVLEKTLEATLANRKLAADKYEQGYLQKTDLLAIEVRVTEVNNQLQYARSNVKNASDYLLVLMNEPAEATLLPSDPLVLVPGAVQNAPTLPMGRTDIQAMVLASEAYGKKHQADKMTFLPRLNAFGSYELYDDRVFGAGAGGYLIGAQLSWNLLEGTKRFSKVQKSKAAFEKSKLQLDQYVSQSRLELNKAGRMLKDAENKLKLTGLALEQSKEALRIRTNRFKEGLEKTSDLLTSETQYAQKQLEYYQTIFEHNYAQAYLAFLTKE
ncbi:TolC family protein [Fulvivirgaceae bacterium BMA12]|uniref:TolC family protein n=1 Tax=Agaribacillus aureus TaxID=3051825 RepID=A0ABT8LJ41_9BACT|nr:TolC family protein [Fulvivirgaceae bacterium BMA12]